jgi:hypothetical protein
MVIDMNWIGLFAGVSEWWQSSDDCLGGFTV